MKRLSPNFKVFVFDCGLKQIYDLFISPTFLFGRRPNYFMFFMLFMVFYVTLG